MTSKEFQLLQGPSSGVFKESDVKLLVRISRFEVNCQTSLKDTQNRHISNL